MYEAYVKHVVALGI